MNKVLNIVKDIEQGFGWASIQYLITAYQNQLSTKQFQQLVFTLAEDRRLVDENLLPSITLENLSAVQDSVAIITYKTYLFNTY